MMTSSLHQLTLLVSSFAFLFGSATAKGSLKPVKDFEISLMETLNLIDKDDPEEFKSKFAKDSHEIKLCFIGLTEEEGCWQGDVDTVFDPILEQTVIWRTTGHSIWSSSVDNQGGYVNLSLTVTTQKGCTATCNASTYHEVNDQGKITKYYAYSEDSEEFVKCLRPAGSEQEEKPEDAASSEL